MKSDTTPLLPTDSDDAVRDADRRIPRLLGRLVMALGLLTIVFDAPFLREKVPAGLVPIEVLAPGEIRGVSVTLLAIFGIVLVFIGAQMARCKRRAWLVAVLLLLASAMIHLVRGPAPLGAAFDLGFAAVLIATRRHFSAPSDPPSLVLVVKFVPAWVGLVLIYGVVALMLEAGRMTPEPGLAGKVQTVLRAMLGLEPRYSFDSPAFGRVFGWSVFILGMIGLVVTLVLVFRPIIERPRHTPEDWALARHLVRRYGTDTLSYFALRPDKSFFFASDGRAMIPYGYVGGYALACGDPIGAPGSLQLVVDEFVAMCNERAWGIAFLAVKESEAERYERHGLVCQYLGDEAVIDVQQFSLEGRPIRKVRQSVNRLAKHGYSFEMRSALDCGMDLRQQLQAISEKWRGDAPERGYTMSLGSFISTDDPDCMVAIVRDEHGVPRAFFHLVPCGGDQPGYSLDLMRRDPDTPNGLIEFLVCETVLECKARGMWRLSLNFAPFARLLHDEADFTTTQKMQRWIVRRLNPYFQLSSLYTANKKYFPTFVPRVCFYDAKRNFAKLTILYLEAEEWLRVPFLGRTLVPAPGDQHPASHPSLQSSRGDDAVATEALGFVHGEVRPVEDIGGGLAGNEQGDADAQRHADRIVVDDDRRSDRSPGFVDDHGRFGEVVHAVEDDEQLVATEARHEVLGSQRAPDA